METKRIQISDSIPCGILLSLSGGCMDAYSYLCRGHVFANAQTGNMLLFGVNLANGDLTATVKYLLPVLFFSAGIIIADMINARKNFIMVHWRQISVSIEAVILIIVAFLPEAANPYANMMTSFACGVQVESFRVIHDNNIATTMCMGNLRSGLFNLSSFFRTREKTCLSKAILYFGLIVSFILGAVAESILISTIGCYAILLSPVLLLTVLALMFRKSLVYDGNSYI